jgi:hypothetical protein
MAVKSYTRKTCSDLMCKTNHLNGNHADFRYQMSQDKRFADKVVGKHTLTLYFESAFRKARALEGVHGALIGSQMQTARLYVRKAQYQWQWDW